MRLDGNSASTTRPAVGGKQSNLRRPLWASCFSPKRLIAYRRYCSKRGSHGAVRGLSRLSNINRLCARLFKAY